MRRSFVSVIALGLLANIACSKSDGAGGQPEPTPPPAAEAPPAAEVAPSAPAAEAPAPAPTSAVSEARDLTAADLPGDVEPAGDLVRALTWNDGNGENLALFTARAEPDAGSKRLQVVHLAGPEGSRRELRTVKDGVDRCDFDLTADFVADSIRVTDLDGDGQGELTFAYRLACRSDVTPSALKLLLLESGEKYILRGHSQLDLGGGPDGIVGGAFEAEPAASAWPDGFAPHAEAVWNAIKSET